MLDGRMVMQTANYYCTALQVACPAEIVEGKQQVRPIGRSDGSPRERSHPVTVHTIVRMV